MSVHIHEGKTYYNTHKYLCHDTFLSLIPQLKAQHGLVKTAQQPLTRYHVIQQNIAEGSTSTVDLASDSITGAQYVLIVLGV